MDDELKKLKIRGAEQRFPQEQEEGIISPVDGSRVVSLTEVETLDLLCEGEIHGLVTGEYKFSGNVGTIGYESYTFTPFDIAPNTNQRWLPSIFWNEVPVVDKQNRFNYQTVETAFTPGVEDGEVLTRLNSDLSNDLTITRQIGERLRGGGEDFAKIYRVLNREVNSIRVNVKVGALSKTETENSDIFGDVLDTSVQYSIYYRPIFSNRIDAEGFILSKQETIEGKITNGYVRQTEVTLFDSEENNFENDQNFLGWEIKIVRITEDAIKQSLRNATFVDSITEVYGDVYSYPNSAIVFSKFSAEYFQNIPSRAFRTKLLKVKVPNNYDPIKKRYGWANGAEIPNDPETQTEDWNGEFKDEKEWTDNPAWCFYDIVTNPRYGLGRYISEDQIDKWTLYDIARYCDTLVDDGFGGVEPRFTCNLLINSREEAFKVLNDMASIFRGINYYAGGTIFTVQDSLRENKDTFFEFNNSNVINGLFNYSSSSRKLRSTVVLVRYNDKNNFYEPAVEYVEDVDGIRRYGIRQKEITAFGTTSKGQARRLGRWALLTESLETESISFEAGPEAQYLTPGDVIKVYDQFRKEERFAGRVYQFAELTNSGARVLLDDNITGFQTGEMYKFSLFTPTYEYRPTQISDLSYNDFNDVRRDQIQVLEFTGIQASGITGADSKVRTEITFHYTGFNTGDYSIDTNPVFSIEASGTGIGLITTNMYDYYRVINRTEKENEIYEINGLEYNEDKFLKIDSGLAFDSPTVQQAPDCPTALDLSVTDLTANTRAIDFSFIMPNFRNVQGYFVYVKQGSDFTENGQPDNDYFFTTLPTTTLNGQYIPTENNNYFFRVYSFNGQGTLSTCAASGNIEVNNINFLKDVSINSLALYTDVTGLSFSNASASKESGIYTSTDPTFNWQVGFLQNINIPTDFTYRISIRETGVTNKPSSIIYYQETGFISDDPTLLYTFDFTKNLNSLNGPHRTYDIVVEAANSSGDSSAGGNFGEDFGEGDSRYDNPTGYDILFVNNPPLSGIDLATGNKFVRDYHTDRWADAWLTLDGDIQLKMVSGEYESDMAGAYIYYSTSNFTQEQAQGKQSLPPNVTINRTRILGTPNEFLVRANLEALSAFVAWSPFDVFDKGIIDNGDSSHINNIRISNVTQVYKKGTDAENSSFRAWGEFIIQRPNVGTQIQNITLNTNINYNIGGVNLYFGTIGSLADETILTENDLDTAYNDLSFNGSAIPVLALYEIILSQSFGDTDYSAFLNYPKGNHLDGPILIKKEDRLFFLFSYTQQANVNFPKMTPGKYFVGVTRKD